MHAGLDADLPCEPKLRRKIIVDISCNYSSKEGTDFTTQLFFLLITRKKSDKLFFFHFMYDFSLVTIEYYLRTKLQVYMSSLSKLIEGG